MMKRWRVHGRRVGRWVFWCAVLPAVVLVGLRMGWGAYAEWQVGKVKAELKGMGMRVEMGDWEREVKEGENGAEELGQWIADFSASLSTEQSDLISDRKVNTNFWERSFTAEEKELIRGIKLGEEGAVPELERILAKPTFLWERGTTIWGNNTIVVQGPLIIRALLAKSLAAKLDGRREVALRYGELGLRLARVMMRNPSEGGFYFSGTSLRMLAELLEQYGRDETIDFVAVERKYARRLIGNVLDAAAEAEEKPPQLLEYAAARIAAMEKGGMEETRVQWLMYPALELERCRWLRAQGESWRGWKNGVIRGTTRTRGVGGQGWLEEPRHWRFYDPVGTPERFVEMLGRVSDLRAAGILLALHLYQLDHAGKLPGKLGELFPEYLPEVPRDPFDPKGGELGYQGGTDAILWSVGVNGVDDGVRSAPKRSRYRIRELDIVYERNSVVFP